MTLKTLHTHSEKGRRIRIGERLANSWVPPSSIQGKNFLILGVLELKTRKSGEAGERRVGAAVFIAQA
jgi:hypothetical protein